MMAAPSVSSIASDTHITQSTLDKRKNIHISIALNTLYPRMTAVICFEALGTYRSVYGQNEKNTHLGCILVIFGTSMALQNATVSAILVRNPPLISVSVYSSVYLTVYSLYTSVKYTIEYTSK